MKFFAGKTFKNNFKIGHKLRSSTVIADNQGERKYSKLLT